MATDAERQGGKIPKIIAIGGEPATGKTFVVRALLPLLGMSYPFKRGLVEGTFHPPTNTYVVGKYKDGDTFAGTDRLSMGVQKDWPEFLKHCAVEKRNVVFEGDRLFIEKNLTARSHMVIPIFLTADKGVKLSRHLKRKDNQSEKFLKGRQTKYQRLMTVCPTATVFSHENNFDTHRILNYIQKALELA